MLETEEVACGLASRVAGTGRLSWPFPAKRWACPASLNLSPTQEHVRPPTLSHPELFLSPFLKVTAFPGMWQLSPLFLLSDLGSMPRGKRLS